VREEQGTRDATDGRPYDSVLLACRRCPCAIDDHGGVKQREQAQHRSPRHGSGCAPGAAAAASRGWRRAVRGCAFSSAALSGACQGGQAVLAGEVVELPWQHPGAGRELIADAVQLGMFEGCAGKEEWIACAACGQAGVDDPAEWFYAGPAKVVLECVGLGDGGQASVTISTLVYAGSCRRISGVVMCPGSSLASRMTWR
jgi:hypothetical protein